MLKIKYVETNISLVAGNTRIPCFFGVMKKKIIVATNRANI
jgi:hypothetical protein